MCYNQPMDDKFFEAKYPADSRFAEIEKLLLYIKEGNSAQVISVPGGGRSTLLGLLAYNKHVRNLHLKEHAQQYHFVMIDFTEIKNKPLREALKLIFLNIVASLEDRPMDNTYAKAQLLLSESLAENDELVLLQGLKKVISVLALEKNLTVVLLFDKFESYIPSVTPEFFTYMKSLHNTAKYKFSVTFSLHKPLEYLLEPALFADFEEQIEDHLVYLPLLDKPSTTFRIAFIEQALSKTLTESQKKDVLAAAAGHVKLTRIAIEKLLEQGAGNNIPSFLLTQKAIQAALSEIWNSLNPAEQTHFTKHLYPNVLDDEHSRYLKAVGLMDDISITLPLFEGYTEKKREEVQKQKQIITFHPENNTITKDEQILSDSLTNTEFRLLKYFLGHIGEITERSTIIENVWKENKSLAGVTDQALDQLIFRLRRKIEEDPNNPTHLITVKGRGFKFIA